MPQTTNWDRYGDKAIPKDKLITGYYYAGICRNAHIARWNGKEFVHWRYKLGRVFLETIEYWDINGIYDGFIPVFEIGETLPKEITLTNESET